MWRTIAKLFGRKSSPSSDVPSNEVAQKYGANDSSNLDELITLTATGRAALAANQGERAFAILSRKHELVRSEFSEKSVYFATSLVHLAQAHELCGRHKEARGALEEALSRYNSINVADDRLDRLEDELIEVCGRQGHFFEVEKVFRSRISRLKQKGSAVDHLRAQVQDELALLLVNMHRYDDALDLLLDSHNIFEHMNDAKADLAICCLYILRSYLRSNKFEPAASYGRQAANLAAEMHGADSSEVAKCMDELAAALAFRAVECRSSDLAQESLAASAKALNIFKIRSANEPQALIRCQENRNRLIQMLAPLLPTDQVGVESRPDSDQCKQGDLLALPTRPFISHSYRDEDAIKELMKILPSYVKPIIFDSINVAPTEFVSDKLLSGVMGADGMIFIDSPQSNSSFWTAFERDLACRKQKHMFAYNPGAGVLRRVKPPTRTLGAIGLSCHIDDADARVVRKWLTDERSIVFRDEAGGGMGDHRLVLADMSEPERLSLVEANRATGGCYIIFLSRAFFNDFTLIPHVSRQIEEHPESTVVCWLPLTDGGAPMPEGFKSVPEQFKSLPKENFVAFSGRPSQPDFNRNELDDLMVRIVWLSHRLPPRRVTSV